MLLPTETIIFKQPQITQKKISFYYFQIMPFEIDIDILIEGGLNVKQSDFINAPDELLVSDLLLNNNVFSFKLSSKLTNNSDQKIINYKPNIYDMPIRLSDNVGIDYKVTVYSSA